MLSIDLSFNSCVRARPFAGLTDRVQLGEIVIAPMPENPAIPDFHFPATFPAYAAIAGEG
jgi:hypothetical protein